MFVFEMTVFVYSNSCRTPSYLQVDVVVLQFTLRTQRRLDRAELRALRDAPFGEDSTQEAIDVKDQRQTGPGPGQHRPVVDGMERTVQQTDGGVGVITLLAP